ncbi:hypothetical protein [Microcoleus vaginatus]|uniref:hypothetical protein n=1 Tax=Microcoleus vaginatus TaxID=119532 RepID=UPI00403FC14A
MLEFVRSLKTEEQQKIESKAWQASLDLERKRNDVYRRLANSLFSHSAQVGF